MNFTTIAQVEAAETKDLIAFYNAHNQEKPVKKFSDRQAAVKRCSALVESLTPKSDEEFKDAVNKAVAPDEAKEPITPEEEQPIDGKPVHWPFGKGKNADDSADHRQGERRDPTVDVAVVVEKTQITAVAAAMLRKIFGGEIVSKDGNEPIPEVDNGDWIRHSSVIQTEAHRSAFKALVIAGLAEHNGIEGDRAAITVTDKGVEAFKALPDDFGVEADIEKPKRQLSHASNAAGVAASWADPSVAAARLTRDGVTVTVDGKTTTHKSTRDAFRFYRLMDSKHIRFRGQLKAAKAATYEESKKSYLFTIVGTDANTKFDK